MAEEPSSIAAFFVDPFSWASGWQDAPPSFWQGIRAICDKHELLLVADEIVTGFGRTGEWFAGGGGPARPRGRLAAALYFVYILYILYIFVYPPTL